MTTLNDSVKNQSMIMKLKSITNEELLKLHDEVKEYQEYINVEKAKLEEKNDRKSKKTN